MGVSKDTTIPLFTAKELIDNAKVYCWMEKGKCVDRNMFEMLCAEMIANIPPKKRQQTIDAAMRQRLVEMEERKAEAEIEKRLATRKRMRLNPPPPPPLPEMTIETKGGLGIQFAHTNGVLWCSDVLSDSNGAKVGLKPKDKIHAVRCGTEWFRPETSHELLEKIRSLIQDKDSITVRVSSPLSPGRRLIERLVNESERCIRS